MKKQPVPKTFKTVTIDLLFGRSFEYTYQKKSEALLVIFGYFLLVEIVFLILWTVIPTHIELNVLLYVVWFAVTLGCVITMLTIITRNHISSEVWEENDEG